MHILELYYNLAGKKINANQNLLITSLIRGVIEKFVGKSCGYGNCAQAIMIVVIAFGYNFWSLR